jgi:hypothetical protein
MKRSWHLFASPDFAGAAAMALLSVIVSSVSNRLHIAVRDQIG